MTKTEIYSKLTPIIKVYLPEDVSSEHIQVNSNLTKELNINSSHLVDIVLDIEDAFQIEFTNEDMEKMVTVQDTLTIIEAKTNQG